MHGDQSVLNEYEDGLIASFKEKENAVFEERDDYYEIYIDGDYCNNNYTLRILEKDIIE